MANDAWVILSKVLRESEPEGLWNGKTTTNKTKLVLPVFWRYSKLDEGSSQIWQKDDCKVNAPAPLPSGPQIMIVLCGSFPLGEENGMWCQLLGKIYKVLMANLFF